MTFYKWSKTAATDATADSTINWAEGQSPSSVNDSARGMMAAAAKYRDDVSATTLSSTGSANAYSVTSNQAFSALQAGISVGFLANATNTGTCTINVDSLGAKPLRSAGGVELPAASIIAGAAYLACYTTSGDQWLLVNVQSQRFIGEIAWSGLASAPAGWLLCNGAAVSRTTYANLFAAIGSQFGAGDASTTFNVPDMGGRVAAGKEATATRLTSAGSAVDGGTLGAAGGSQTSTLTSVSQLPAYTPSGSVSVSVGAPSITAQIKQATSLSGGGTMDVAVATPNNTTTVTNGLVTAAAPSASGGFTGSQVGSSAPFATQPPTIILNALIKY